jgi:periplasmic protein CpxP/Spy
MSNRAVLAVVAAAFLLPFGTHALAQRDGPPPLPPLPSMGPMQPHRPPLERAFHMGPGGRWWDSPEFAQRIGITPEQQKKMDNIFQQSRLTLIDLHAAVEKQETILEPLVSADQPNEAQILAQIDKVAQSRAELEKANARMLLGLRGVLTADQWKKLQTEEASRRAARGERRNGPGRDGSEGPPRGGEAQAGPGPGAEPPAPGEPPNGR